MGVPNFLLNFPPPNFLNFPRALGCADSQILRALMTLGACSFDSSADRSVLSSMRVVRQDLEAYFGNFPNVLQADAVEVSVRLTRSPAGIWGKTIWPQDRLLELVVGLGRSDPAD